LKILITGANGFLGKIIYQELRPIFDVTTLARRDSDYCVDLSSEQNINFTEKFDLVIHLAGRAHFIPKTSIDQDSFFNINVKGTRNLLESLKSSGIPKQFLFVSSVSVYGLNKGVLITENADLKAIDPYGKSKIEAEAIVQKWCNENNVICTILRLPLIVGPNPPGNLGSMIKGIKNGYYFNIAGGNAKKSMVLASDIAKFILNAAEVGGTYNLTDGIHPSFNELSKNISSQLGRIFVPNLPKFIAIILAKFGDLLGNEFPINTNKLKKITSDLTLDDSKARKAFGWNPTPVLIGFKLIKGS
jgi:nucleoside-diphosphate-sugar epimerase